MATLPSIRETASLDQTVERRGCQSPTAGGIADCAHDTSGAHHALDRYYKLMQEPDFYVMLKKSALGDAVVTELGKSGLAGLIAVAIILWLFSRRTLA